MNIFTAVEYCCILHGRVCVMLVSRPGVLVLNYLVPGHFFLNLIEFWKPPKSDLTEIHFTYKVFFFFET